MVVHTIIYPHTLRVLTVFLEIFRIPRCPISANLPTDVTFRIWVRPNTATGKNQKVHPDAMISLLSHCEIGPLKSCVCAYVCVVHVVNLCPWNNIFPPSAEGIGKSLCCRSKQKLSSSPSAKTRMWKVSPTQLRNYSNNSGWVSSKIPMMHPPNPNTTPIAKIILWSASSVVVQPEGRRWAHPRNMSTGTM